MTQLSIGQKLPQIRYEKGISLKRATALNAIENIILSKIKNE